MKKRLLIVDDDPAVGAALQTQTAGSRWLEVCGQTTGVEETWRALHENKPDIVLLGGVQEAERGVLCQQFRLAFPHLLFIAACSEQELIWEPFFRNLGMWVIAKPIHSGQLEALAMQLSSMTAMSSMHASMPAGSAAMGGMSGTGTGLTGIGTTSNGMGGAAFPGVEAGMQAAGFSGVAEAKPHHPYVAGSGQQAKKRLITVYGPKGGVGKTFLSRELAIYFAQRKLGGNPLKVLAVDFNLDLGTFATALNLPRTPNLYSWVQDIDERLHDWIRSQGREPGDLSQEEWQVQIGSVQLSPQEVDRHIVVHEASGLYVLTSPRDIRHSFEIKDYHLYLILDALKNSHYDVILIDTAPDTTDATIQALFFAEQVVMVGNPVVDSIENIQRILKLLREADYPEERISLCMNRLQRKEMFTLDEIRAYFQLHPSKKIFPIPDDQEVKKSINTGNPVMLHPGKLAAKDAIEALGKALLPLEEEADGSGKKKEKERASLWKWLRR